MKLRHALLLAALVCAPSLVVRADDRITTLERAARLIDAGDLAQAEAALQPLLEPAREDPIALNLLGVIRIEQSRPDDGRKLFLKASEKGPHLAGPHVNLARLDGPEHASDAISQLKRALQLAPDDQPAQALLRTIAEKAALAAARSGDNKGAVAIMLQARAVLPRDPELLYQFGLVAMQAGMFPDAEAGLQEALRIRPAYPEAMYGLARAYLADAKGQLAEEQLRRYLALRPDDATAQYGLGYVLVSEEKLDEARSAFERSLALAPDQTESVFQLGIIAIQQGNREAARDYFAKVLARDPRHAGALTETGVFAFREHRYEDAAAALQRAVESAPSYQKAHYYLALALAKLGRKEEAAREFQAANRLKKGPLIERLPGAAP